MDTAGKQTMTPTSPTVCDAILIQRIVAARDVAALEALATRYTQPLFNLAQHLTGDSMLAEDIVQEVLLHLWKAAHCYDPALGSVSAWLFRIVANKSIGLKGRLQKMDARARRRQLEASAMTPPAPSLSESGEVSEALLALRSLVRELPDLERNLVALYFGSKFSQDQIAQALRIPQRTVSNRLAAAVQKLRSCLKGAGFGSLAGCEELLTEAVHSTYAAPPHLYQLPMRVTAALPSHAPNETEAEGAALPSTTALSWRKSRWLAWAALILSGAIALALSGRNSSLAADPKALALSSPPLALGSAPSDQPTERFKRSWNFNSAEQLKDFEVKGSVPHLRGRGKDGGGCIELNPKNRLGLLLPQQYLPLRLTLDLRRTAPQGNQLTLKFSNINEEAAFRVVCHPERLGEGEWCRATCYVTEETHDFWVEPWGRTTLFVFSPVKTGQAMELNGAHFLLDELTVEQVGPGEIPDVHKFLQAWQRLRPQAPPLGEEALVPWLSTPGQKVYFTQSNKNWHGPEPLIPPRRLAGVR